jgi:hypothetical protein
MTDEKVKHAFQVLLLAYEDLDALRAALDVARAELARVTAVTTHTPDDLGRIVRRVWVEFCLETGHIAKPGHIAPWEDLDEWAREVDRRIGVAVASAVLAAAPDAKE